MGKNCHTNKYLIKYKWHLIFGFLFVIISTVLQILPAILVRKSIDLVIDNIKIYRAFENLELQKNFFDATIVIFP